MLLKGKNAIITGTNRGIGRGILEVFAQNGANIWAHARKETKSFIDEINELSEKYNVEINPIFFDLTDYNSMKEAIYTIRLSKRPIDILVNNAGVMKDAIIGIIQRETIEYTFSVNVFALIEMLQLVSKLMIRQQNGSIINMTSIVGVNGNRGQLVYSASKGAVISLTKTAAKELAPNNIRVNAIAPGMIDTDMFRSIGEKYITERVGNVGMKRLGTPEDVAKTCLFLASDMSRYVTGQILGVDGSALV